MATGYRHVCACCHATVHAAVWDIAQPASGKSVAVCAACGDHIRLLTTGEVWFPPHCPSTVPRPKFRVLTGDGVPS